MAEGTSEESVRVLRVLSDDDVEVCDCALMILNHLVGLGSLVDILDLTGHIFDALNKLMRRS